MDPFDTKAVPVRFHMLKAFDETPAHALIKMKSDGSEGSRDMELGTAAHAILFNTDRVVAATMKRDPRSSKWQDFERLHAGALIVTQSDYDEANYIVDAVRGNVRARELLDAQGVLMEQTVFQDFPGEPYDNRSCRFTPDLVLPDVFIADFKTSKSAKPEKWAYLMRDYDIAGQIAWYSVAYPRCEKFYTVVVEKGTNIVQVYDVDEPSMQLAWDRNMVRLDKLRKAEETGAWPAYSADEVLVIQQAAAWPQTT